MNLDTEHRNRFLAPHGPRRDCKFHCTFDLKSAASEEDVAASIAESTLGGGLLQSGRLLNQEGGLAERGG